MDFLRIALIAGIAIVGYLLLYQWQQDYGQPDYGTRDDGESAQTVSAPSNPPSVASEQTRIANDANDRGSSPAPVLDPVLNPALNNVPPGIPPESAQVAAQNGAAESSDLPQQSVDWDNTADEAESPRGEAVSPQASAVVNVATDVLNVEIDLRGGDIVGVSLPAYPLSLERPNTPFTLLSNRNATYVSQSGVIGRSGKDLDAESRPLFTAERNSYTLDNQQELSVALTYQWGEGLEARKIFDFSAGSYLIKVRYEITNRTAEPWKGYLFTQLKRDDAPDPGENQSGGFGLPTYLGTAYYHPEEKYSKLGFDDIAEKGSRALRDDIQGGWLAIVQHYFLSAWIPNPDQIHHYYSDRRGGDNIIGATSPPVEVVPGETVALDASFFAGPKIQEKLKEVSDGLHLAVDYGFLFFISDLLFILLKLIHSVVGNWGWAIIFLTCLIKLLFYYPSAMSYRSMANMRRVQPELLRIRERYADDRQQLSQAMMKLYRDEKINPLGGCLPVLLQMPVFFALYWTLLESVELRQAPFMGWINDLSAMDEYFVLPLLMGASMYIQSLLNPAPPDPMQAKMMRMMPIVFTVFFLFFPSGLVLYWLTNNILSILQQWSISRKVEQQALSASNSK